MNRCYARGVLLALGLVLAVTSGEATADNFQIQILEDQFEQIDICDESELFQCEEDLASCQGALELANEVMNQQAMEIAELQTGIDLLVIQNQQLVVEVETLGNTVQIQNENSQPITLRRIRRCINKIPQATTEQRRSALAKVCQNILRKFLVNKAARRGLEIVVK